MADVFSPALLQRYPFVERESLLVTRPWLQWLQLLGTSLGPFMDAGEVADLLTALSTDTLAGTQATQALASALLGVQSRPDRLARLEAAIQALHGALLALQRRHAPVPPVPGLDALTMQALLQQGPRSPASRVQPGTAWHVPRYQSPEALTLEASPLTVEAAGNLTAQMTGAASLLLVNEHTTTAGQLVMESYQPGTGGLILNMRKATGTAAAPVRVTAGHGSMNVTGSVWARNAADSADAWIVLASIRGLTEAADAQGRVSGAITIHLSPGVSATPVEIARITAAGWLGLNTNAPTARLDVNADTIRLRTARTPASATAAGNAGDVCWDANFVYVCVAANTWKRAALTTW